MMVDGNLDQHISQNRLGVSSWVWGSDYYRGAFSLLEMPQRAAERGYSLLEFNDFMLPPPRWSRVTRPWYRLIPYGNKELWRYRYKTLIELRRRMEMHQQQCVCWTMNSDFTLPFGDGLSRRVYGWWGKRAAELVGAPMIRIITGGENGVAPTVKTAVQIAQFVDYLLQQSTIKDVVLENHWGISTDIDRFVHLYLDVSGRLSTDLKPHFGLCLDPTNMEPDNWIGNWKKMVPHAKHVHLKQLPDRCSSSLNQLVQMLDGVGYKGLYVVESGDVSFV